MKIPVTRTLRTEDFPNESWAPRLLPPINAFFNYAFLALTKGLNFDDNLQGFSRDLDVTITPSSFPLFLSNDLGTLVRELTVTRASEDGSPVVLLVPWGFTDDGRIQISEINVVKAGAISAPTTGKRYQATLRFRP